MRSRPASLPLGIALGAAWLFLPTACGEEEDALPHEPARRKHQRPVAAPGGPYRGVTITFDGSGSYDPDAELPLRYTWSFGDGAIGVGVTPTHTYQADGTYDVTLVVTDSAAVASDPARTSATVAASAAGTALLVGTGNIARCGRDGDEHTAELIDRIPGAVFTIGDNAYPNGTSANLADCFGPSWGRHKHRTRPVIGNHEYDSSATAAPYFSYFGAAAGEPGKGYYSYDLGAWHIIALNSNWSHVATAAGSPQEQWLKADLAATTKRCVLAMWHHPRFYSTTSPEFFPTTSVEPFWNDLYAARAELVLNGHMHDYERFAPQNPKGVADPQHGIRQIIVGTGGAGLDPPNTTVIPNSEVRISGVLGVLKLTLREGAYAWQFVPVVGETASDSGAGTCH